MGKASRTKQEPDRRARIAAQREAQRRAEQRRRIYLAGGSILVVVIVVVAFVLVKLNSSGGTAGASSNGPTGTALAKVTKQVTDVPTSVTDKVAGGGDSGRLVRRRQDQQRRYVHVQEHGSYFATVDGTALTQNGKPEVLYIGSEYCPFCAAQRWAMVNAFSRFGTFTGLTTTHSSSTDTDPNTPTLHVLRLDVHEQVHLVHVGRGAELPDRELPNSSVAYVHAADPDRRRAGASQTDLRPGRRTSRSSTSATSTSQVGNISPLEADDAGRQDLGAGGDRDERSRRPRSARPRIANANYETAAICALTNNQPATACTPTIQKLETTLAK